MSYRILYLPTGEYIRDYWNGYGMLYKVPKPCIFDTKMEAYTLLVSMIRPAKPRKDGFMKANEIMFPSIKKHFEIVEVGDNV